MHWYDLWLLNFQISWPNQATQVECLPNTMRATAWAVGMEADFARGKFL